MEKCIELWGIELVALEISKHYDIDKKQDIQAMLYTFALKFLNSNELKQVKEVMKMTELGKMLIQEGREEGRKEGKLDVVKALLKEGLLTKEQIAKVTKLSIEKIEEIEKDVLGNE